LLKGNPAARHTTNQLVTTGVRKSRKTHPLSVLLGAELLLRRCARQSTF
jgi:hypothetical protein